jgi:Flp pilus assembly protein TadD
MLALPGCQSDKDDIAQINQIVATQAEAAEHERNYEAAAHQYATLYESDHDNPVTAEAVARNLRHGGRLEEARQVLEDALARLGPKPRLLLEKGKVELGLGRADLAVQTLQTAVQVAPTEWEPPATLAIALDRLGRYDEAAVQYRAAIDHFPDNPDVLNNYGLSRALAGHIDEGLSMLRKAVVMPGASPRVRENLKFMETLAEPPPPAAHPGKPAKPVRPGALPPAAVTPQLKARALTEPAPIQTP